MCTTKQSIVALVDVIRDEELRRRRRVDGHLQSEQPTDNDKERRQIPLISLTKRGVRYSFGGGEGGPQSRSQVFDKVDGTELHCVRVRVLARAVRERETAKVGMCVCVCVRVCV